MTYSATIELRFDEAIVEVRRQNLAGWAVRIRSP